MKISKLFTLMAAAAMMLTTACSSDEPVVTPTGSETSVTFTVDLPSSISNRARTAYADGTTATRLTYAVYRYDADAKAYEYVLSKSGLDVIDRQAEVTLNLLSGETYAVTFWAAAKDAPYTLNVQDGTMTVNYDEAVANDEKRDAFYACEKFEVNAANALHYVKLTRPFAQLNIGTSDFDESRTGANFTAAKSAISVEACGTMDLLTGEATDIAVRKFDLNTRPQGETFPVGDDTYDYLAMVYALMPNKTDQIISKVTLTMEDPTGSTLSRPYENIPLQRNYRTNIYGQLLTTTNVFNVEIKPGFASPDINCEVWDGSSVESPVIDENGNAEVKSAAQFAGLVELVHQGNSFKDKVVSLDVDLDLNSEEWTPIGGVRGDNPKCFSGTFDGQGHTIKNMSQTIYNAQTAESYRYGRGLFFQLNSSAVVKNITIEDPIIFTGYVTGNVYGVVAGYAYGNVTFENVHVKGGHLLGFGKIGGILGMAADASGVTTMKNCSVEDLHIYYGYNAGGLIGLAQNEVVLDNCTTSNISRKSYTTSGGTFAALVNLENEVFSNEAGKEVTVSGEYAKYVSGDVIYYYVAWGDYYTDYYYEKDCLLNADGAQLADGLPHNK
jgi:hypothetical protein